MLRREGWAVNHKSVYRLYSEQSLQMRQKVPKRRVQVKLRENKPLISAKNDCWSMDFVSDNLFCGKKLRVLTIIDNFTRESSAIEVEHSLKGLDVVRVLEHAVKRHGKPKAIKVDNGPEFIAKELDLWAYRNQIILDFSKPGKPTDNAFIESFNGRFRQECLNQHWFLTLEDAREKIYDCG